MATTTRPRGAESDPPPMRAYIVHLSDAAAADHQTPVFVEDGDPVSVVAQIAVDEFVEALQGEIQYPLFIDIHLAENYEPVAWMHRPVGMNEGGGTRG